MPPRSRCGRPGVLHGGFSYVLQDDDGQTLDVHSISAGLDYPGTGPEHSYWKDSGRVRYTTARDDEVLGAFDALARSEGILPALESSHAVCRGDGDRRRPAGRTRWWWFAFPAAATRTRPRSPGCAAWSFERPVPSPSGRGLG